MVIGLISGRAKGELSPWAQTFAWDGENSLFMLGFAYTGWMDALAIFDRALTAAEMARLYQLPDGVKSLPKR